MQASFYIIVRNGFSMNFKRMMIAYTHGAHDCPRYPGQSAQFNGHVGGQHDVSENALCVYFNSFTLGATKIKPYAWRNQLFY